MKAPRREGEAVPRGAGLFAGAALLAGVMASAGVRPAERPNILWILGDDCATHAVGAYGESPARTPSLDRLGAEGAVFLRAYCNSPVCTPSRQSLLTGRYPHATGVTLLSTPLGDGEVTLAEVLRGAGYETAAIGKMHFNGALRHGFDVLMDTPEHGKRLEARPPAALPAGAEVLGPWKPFKDPARVWLNGSYLPYPAREADMAGTFFAGEAAEFLRRKRDRLFFLVVSFHEPHSPFHFPIEDAGRLDPEAMLVPGVGPEDPPQVPLIFRDLTATEKRRIAAAYYTSAGFLDRNAGRVLEALRQAGCDGDTIVVFAGDNGYCLGHHGRFEKHCFFEESVRVPLMIRWPAHIPAGQKRSELVELADIFPTMLEACGVASPAGRHGKSLLGLLTGRSDREPLRESVVSFYFENEEAMVRTQRWKLIYSSGRRAREDGYRTDDPTPGRYRRLYDLESDPGERRSLHELPEHAELARRLEETLLRRLEETSPEGLRAPAGLPREERLDRFLVPPEVRRGHGRPGEQ